MIRKLEPTFKGTLCNSAMEIVYLPLRRNLLSRNDQLTVLGFNVQFIFRKPGNRQSNTVRILVSSLDIVRWVIVGRSICCSYLSGEKS